MEIPDQHQQQLPSQGQTDVTGLLIKLLSERSQADPRNTPIVEQLLKRQKIGIERYGRSLETYNGRDALTDLTEELIDGLQYATQVRLETEDLVCSLCRAGVCLLDAAVTAGYQGRRSDSHPLDVYIEEIQEINLRLGLWMSGRAVLQEKTSECVRLYIESAADFFQTFG